MIPEQCVYKSVCSSYHPNGLMCNNLIGERHKNCYEYKAYRMEVEAKHNQSQKKPSLLERMLRWLE